MALCQGIARLHLHLLSVRTPKAPSACLLVFPSGFSETPSLAPWPPALPPPASTRHSRTHGRGQSLPITVLTAPPRSGPRSRMDIRTITRASRRAGPGPSVGPRTLIHAPVTPGTARVGTQKLKTKLQGLEGARPPRASCHAPPQPLSSAVHLLPPNSRRPLCWTALALGRLPPRVWRDRAQPPPASEALADSASTPRLGGLPALGDPDP